MHQDSETLFGYQVGESAYGPTPPPEIAATGAPILTSDEYDNNRQFLDFFTTNGLEESDFLNTLHGISQEVFPNFQGASSAFGRPDLILYEQSTSSTASYAQNHDIASYVNHPTLYPLKEKDVAFSSSEHGVLASSPSPKKALTSSGKVYHQSHRCSDDGPQTASQNDVLRSQRTALGFGSDSCFANQRYAPPPGAEDIELVEGRILQTLNSFEPSHSAATTERSSPVISKKKRTLPDSDSKLPIDVQTSDKRRRKSGNVNPRVHISPLKTAKHTDSRQKVESDQRSPSPPALSRVSSSQRRRSRASEPKRQNLTEKEKKENHIRSEQKRRNQIKEGFANLLALMPEGTADGSSNSKCIVLSRAVDWLTDLQNGNKELRAQLRLLDVARC